MIRLFVGLAIPDGVAARLSMLCAGLPGATWGEPANLHLTLRFIGEVEDSAAEEIDHMLAGIQSEAFSLELSGLGTFGEGPKTRALWAGVAPSPALAHLHAKIESAVVRTGQPPEGRKFTPHVDPRPPHQTPTLPPAVLHRRQHPVQRRPLRRGAVHPLRKPASAKVPRSIFPRSTTPSTNSFLVRIIKCTRYN